MKKVFAIILVLCLLLSMAACTNTEKTVSDAINEETGDTAGADVENEAWDSLEAIGKIETENGISYVTITLPSDFVGTGITQEELDKDAGQTYLSATLNEDDSVTYKLTKSQHKDMLDGIVIAVETSLKEIIDSPDYAITNIEHNKDFSVFNVYVSTAKLGLTENFTTLMFYMYGGMYRIFSGGSADKFIVNFYDPDGALLYTADSSEMGNFAESFD